MESALRAIEKRLFRHHIWQTTRDIPLADVSKKNQADGQFKKLQRAEEGKKALSDYEADVIATRAKTARLRELRLAREAAEQAAAPKVLAKAKSSGPKGKTVKRPAAKLEDFLDDQQGGGRKV
jgi:hypothetical protein